MFKLGTKKMRDEKNSYEKLEAKNRQNLNPNGFGQTFFSPQAQMNDYYQSSNAIQGGNRASLPMHQNFIEVYQPDCRANQIQVPERSCTRTSDSFYRDTSMLEDSDINQLFNYSNEESFEDDYWRNEEPLQYDF
mmetsp:Transcript_6299/g.7016  ORF Transcript_6299/g.7016 Transcript_6299/m.7016 type:complete len:134 (+) Transcript_6299:564-965(+)